MAISLSQILKIDKVRIHLSSSTWSKSSSPLAGGRSSHDLNSLFLPTHLNPLTVEQARTRIITPSGAHADHADHIDQDEAMAEKRR